MRGFANSILCHFTSAGSNETRFNPSSQPLSQDQPVSSRKIRVSRLRKPKRSKSREKDLQASSLTIAPPSLPPPSPSRNLRTQALYEIGDNRASSSDPPTPPEGDEYDDNGSEYEVGDGTRQYSGPVSTESAAVLEDINTLLRGEPAENPLQTHEEFEEELDLNQGVRFRDLADEDKRAVQLESDLRIEKKVKHRPPIGGELILFLYQGEILKLGSTIKLLHSWARFMITNDSVSLMFSSFPVPPPVSQTDKEIIKVFVRITKDSKKNRIYKNSDLYKVVAGKPVYLRINDKKRGRTEGVSYYGFIDTYDANLAENKI